jgi:hypothetical protein
MRLFDDGALTLGWASPAGEQMRGGAAPPAGRLAGRLTRSLSQVETEAAEKTNALGFRAAAAPQFCSAESLAQLSISDERLTHVGLNEAQAGGENAGPSLRCFNIHVVGLITEPFFSSGPDQNQFLGRNQL